MTSMDEQMRRRLSDIELPVEPSRPFVDGLYDELAGRLGHLEPRVQPRPASGHSWRDRILLVAALIALLLALVATIVGAGAVIERFLPQSVLDHIRTTGVVRVVVSPELPQVPGVEGGISGFDIDLAEEIARRLDGRAQLIVRSADEITTAEHPDWQLALAGAMPAGANERYLATRPYYWWPIYVVGSSGNGSLALADLAGADICVVAGGIGESWLMPAARSRPLDVLASPPAANMLVEPDEDACLADVAAGSARAFVTETLLPVDLTTRGGLVVAGAGPVAAEPRVMLIGRDQLGAEDLRDALDDLIEAMRVDGTLADLSRRWFGGQDLTSPGP
jgi:putative amino-acid transport system substrate-binding protein